MPGAKQEKDEEFRRRYCAWIDRLEPDQSRAALVWKKIETQLELRQGPPPRKLRTDKTATEDGRSGGKLQ